MIPFLLGLAKSKAFWIVTVAIAIVVILWLALIAYGDSRYEAGEISERGKWEQKLGEAREHTREVERRLHAAEIRLNEAIRERDLARQQALVRVTERIENAPDFETRFSAYLEHRNSLREQSAERHTRAWNDYMSTVAPAPSPGPSSDRSEFRLATFGARSTLCDDA